MNFKRQAAERALELVHNGMVLGLGSGSTVAFFVDLLGESYRAGKIKDIQAIPTSEATAQQARTFGIPLTTLRKHPELDLAVDGADEVDPQLNLIKGLGRALLREKVVEIHTQRLVIIVDEGKLVPRLGSRGPLPVEVITFEVYSHVDWLNTLGCRAEQWFEEDGSPVITENGNYLVRCWFEQGILDPHSLDRVLADRPGIVEHGLFLDMARHVVVAGVEGIRVLERDS